jgi:hypothetical protein
MSKICKILSEGEISMGLSGYLPNDVIANLLVSKRKIEKQYPGITTSRYLLGMLKNTSRIRSSERVFNNLKDAEVYYQNNVLVYPLVKTPRKLDNGNYSVYIYSHTQFQEIYNILQSKAERLSDEQLRKELKDLQLDANYKIVDGEIIPLEGVNDPDIDYSLSINSQYELVLKMKNEERTAIQKTIASTTDPVELDKLNKKLDFVDKQIAELSDKPNFSDVMNIMDIDIQQIEELLNNEVLSAHDIVMIQDKIDFWESENFKSEFFQNDERGNSPNWKQYSSQLQKFINLKQANLNLMYESTRQIVNSKLERQYSPEEWAEMSKNLLESDVLQATLRGQSTVRNPFIQLVDYVVKQQLEQARVRYIEFAKELAEITEQLKSKSDKTNPYKLFLQLNSKGEWTGNLTHRFSQDYFDKNSETIVKDWSNKSQVKKRIDWLKNNTIVFDYRKLFYDEYIKLEEGNRPAIFTEEDKQTHIEELKKHLGEKGFEIYYERAVKKFEDYKETLKDIREEDLEEWKKANSPFAYMDKIREGFDTGRFYNYDSIITVPRRFDLKNNPTGWYDNNFSQIESDETYLKYYEFLTQSLSKFRKYFPDNDNIQVNYLPEIKESGIIKNLFSNPTVIPKEIFEFFINEISENEIFTNHLDSKGKVKRSLPVYMMSNQLGKLTYMEKEIIKDQAAKKYSPETETNKFNDYVTQLENKKLASKLENKSKDLEKVLLAHSLSAETYKYKAQVEDFLKISQHLVDNAQENIVEPNGETGKKLFYSKRGGLENTKKSFAYFVDNYYGVGKNKKSSVKIAKDLESKELIKEYSEELKKIELEQDPDLEKIEEIKNKIKSLQTNFVASNVGDMILNYVRVKALGWNPLSATANMGFALVSNMIHAAGNEDFSETEFLQALWMLKENVFKSFTADTIKSKRALKIGALMKEFGVIGDVTEQGDYTKKNSIEEKLKILLPYQMTMRAEFLNYGSTFIAIMLNKKIKNKKGEDKSLFDAYILDSNNNLTFDSENFDNADDWTSVGKKKIKLALKVEAINMIIHGNYSFKEAVAIKKTFLGRALVMFRNWVAEGFANRMQEERTSEILERQVKGRYRSYYSSKTKSGESIGTLKGIQYTLQEMGRILTKGLYNSQGINQLTDVDRANLAKNAMELNFYLALLALSILLKSLADGDDDEDLFAVNFFLNSLNRVQDDITFYSSPSSFEKIQRSTIPAFSLWKDIKRLSNAGIRFINDEDGINNSTTLLEATARMFPGGSSGVNTYKAMQEEFKFN